LVNAIKLRQCAGLKGLPESKSYENCEKSRIPVTGFRDSLPE